ncbi:MAG: hypothetical protein IOC92_06405 [Rhodobacter sp.]|nr:hypothetical protein [Rhodobacter sp.]MCA3457040.1 hypothetical protein [Rhodobacter sp.]MCA3460408.1 hypothetical protein [Rhodobacter sp.]MCA3465415.1 hypothetical protein [Rhodobacter sp.]MCA3466533.1 hypothetical protein [Rhodobacter sp.]
MKKVVRVLACCAVLAGCAGAEAEVAMKAVDFSKPVPPRIYFVECGPLEGITMYPVPLPGKYTVEGKYRLSSSVSDLSIRDLSLLDSRDDRIVVKIPDDRIDRINAVNANFFIHGLANGCTGVFSAEEVVVMRTERRRGITSELSLGFAQNVDEAFRVFDTDPASKANLDQNGLFLEISARTGPREVTSESIFFLDGEVYAPAVVR